MPWKGFLAATVAVLLVVASPAAAATFTVTGIADTPPTTGCTGLECPSIRAALVAAAASDGPDTIVVRAGTHQLTNGQLEVTTPVEIVGQGARTTSVRGAPGGFRVLSVAAGVTASVTRVTLRDGQALDENGGGFLAGGIVVNRGTLTLDQRADHRRARLQRRRPGQPGRHGHAHALARSTPTRRRSAAATPAAC